MYFISICYLNFFFSSFFGLLYQTHFWIHVLYVFLCIYNIACICTERKHVALGFLNLANFT
jgi:hypothetical protein